MLILLAFLCLLMALILALDVDESDQGEWWQ